MMTLPADFLTARATYDSHLDELRPSTGQWVLIRRTDIIGIYPDWETVSAVAETKFPDNIFYIRQIETPIYLEFDILPPKTESLDQAA